MAAKARYSHGMHAAAGKREAVKLAPHVRHGRDTEATRERIARPLVSIPRKLQDWR